MWYLEQREGSISEETLDFEMTVVKKVIKKLLKTVSCKCNTYIDKVFTQIK
jgi:hypothetical protein